MNELDIGMCPKSNWVTISKTQAIYLFYWEIVHPITNFPSEFQKVPWGELGAWFHWRVAIVVVMHSAAFPKITKQVTIPRILHHNQWTSFITNKRKSQGLEKSQIISQFSVVKSVRRYASVLYATMLIGIWCYPAWCRPAVGRVLCVL